MISSFSSAVVSLECGAQRGTAFAISSCLYLTCRHCILASLDSGAEILLERDGQAIPVEHVELELPSTVDLAFLRPNLEWIRFSGVLRCVISVNSKGRSNGKEAYLHTGI